MDFRLLQKEKQTRILMVECVDDDRQDLTHSVSHINQVYLQPARNHADLKRVARAVSFADDIHTLIVGREITGVGALE